MFPSIACHLRLVVAATLLACAYPSTASAQYFWPNKVQYKDLDFQVLKTEHFDIYDPDGGAVEPVAAFTSGKDLNPEWAPDSRALFFISDRDGIANLYLVTLDGEVSQITTVSTGISGITGSSPALSVASRTGTAAFSVFDAGNYHVYTLDVGGLSSPGGAGPTLQPVEATGTGAPVAATLPPLDRQASDVVALLADASYGLPAKQEYEVAQYKSRLSLKAIGQPTLAIGADRFGAAIGGGIGFSFSDMLGDQRLATAVQFSSLGGSFSAKNTGAQIAYLNRAKRWNWGLVGGQVPYLTGGAQVGVGAVNGQTAFIQQTIIFRQTDRSVGGLVAYPFNRAQRVEFQGGLSQISFD